MARPRYRGNDKTALDKIEEAFWDSLQEGPYSDMTIASIVRKAGINRNTFYYHYRDIDEMARSIVSERLLDPLAPELVAKFSQSGEAFPAEFYGQYNLEQRLMRFGLIASDNSAPQLRALLGDAVTRIWCEHLGIVIDQLDFVDQLLLGFTLNGMFAMLASFAQQGRSFGPEFTSDPRVETLIKQNYERLQSLGKSGTAARTPSSSGSM